MKRCISHHLNTVGRRYFRKWSPLESAFNSMPTRKCGSQLKSGLFGVDQLAYPEGFKYITEECLLQSQSLLDEALDAQKTRKMVEIFDDLSNRLCQVADLAEFVRFVNPNEALSTAAEYASNSVSGVVERLNTNVELYGAIKKAVQERGMNETPLDTFVGNLFIFDFEQSGIHLPEAQRNRVVDLNNTILELGQEFVRNVSEPRVVDRKSLPNAFRDIFPGNAHKAIVSTLYTDHPDASVRELAYRIYLHHDPAQDSTLNALLHARHTLANLCGFPTYAHRALRGSILDHPAKVTAFLDQITDTFSAHSSRELKQLASQGESNSNGGIPNIWDISYLSHRYKRDVCHAAYEEECAPYLSLGTCFEGLNMIYSAIFGVTLRVVDDIDAGEVWHADVYKLEVCHDTEGVLGYIYCDLYERRDGDAKKPNQDSHFTIQGSKLLADGSTYQTPIVVLLLNLPNPRRRHQNKWSAMLQPPPTLLTPAMLENLFHEMGHAMHSMLGRTVYQHVSGTRCSTDLAEVPSILMEYFACDARILTRFARHYETGEQMPPELVRKMCSARNLFGASDTQQQVFYAALDQVLHSEYPFKYDERSCTSTDVLARVQERYYGVPYVAHTAWHLRFSHLVGYGAKYYAYLVSRAIARLVWVRCFEADPLSRESGERYRREFLAHGGGKPPLKLIDDFLSMSVQPENLASALTEEIVRK